MFGYFDISTFENYKKKNNVPSEQFSSFYNKRYYEAIKDFIEKPKFSMKYFMVMNNIQNTIFEQSKNEYILKYNLSNDYFEKNNINLYNMNINENNTRELETTIVKEIKTEQPQVRRSARIKNQNKNSEL